MEYSLSYMVKIGVRTRENPSGPRHSLSPVNSSRDLFVDSGRTTVINTRPTMLHPKSMKSVVRRDLLAYRNQRIPMIAPPFPPAPVMPWHVDRSRAGKTSAGRMNVVELGPKFVKNIRAEYMTAKQMCP